MTNEELTGAIIGAAIAVHRQLGPGLLESSYEACLFHLLLGAGLRVDRQKAVPAFFQGQRIDCAYRLDLLVEKAVVIEIKAVERLIDVHMAQMLTYLKWSRCKVGLILNFNVAAMKDGIRRVVLDYDEHQPLQVAHPNPSRR